MRSANELSVPCETSETGSKGKRKRETCSITLAKQNAHGYPQLPLVTPQRGAIHTPCHSGGGGRTKSGSLWTALETAFAEPMVRSVSCSGDVLSSDASVLIGRRGYRCL